jgi:hypothetical protein
MDKIYVGRGKQSKYGIRVNLCLDDMCNYSKDNIEKATNGKKYISLNVNNLKQEDERGNTHSVSIDTWKPEKKEESSSGKTNKTAEELEEVPW